jgi:hypothetical protein
MPFGGVQGEYSFDAFGDTQKELTLYEVTDHGLHPAQQTEPHP